MFSLNEHAIYNKSNPFNLDSIKYWQKKLACRSSLKVVQTADSTFSFIAKAEDDLCNIYTLGFIGWI